MAKGSRSKYVGGEASLDVFQGELDWITGGCIHHREKFASGLFDLGVIVSSAVLVSCGLTPREGSHVQCVPPKDVQHQRSHESEPHPERSCHCYS